MPTSIIAATAVAGLGLEAFGMSKANAAAKKNNANQQAMIANENIQNALKQQLLGLDYNRKKLQLLRSAQQAKAISIATATNQGAKFGSALPGALAQNTGEFNTYDKALNQNFEIASQDNTINTAINANKIGIANAQMDQQEASGFMSLGGSLVNVAGMFGKFGAVGQGQAQAKA